MGDYHILMQFDLDASRADVHRALSTEGGITSWWSRRAALTPEGGLRVSFPGDSEEFQFAVAVDTDERVEWVTGDHPVWWAGTTIRWDMSDRPDASGTRLLFSHRDYDPGNPTIAIVTPAWAQIILRLKGYAETGKPQPFFEF